MARIREEALGSTNYSQLARDTWRTRINQELAEQLRSVIFRFLDDDIRLRYFHESAQV